MSIGYRFFSQTVDVATGYSNMAFVTIPDGCMQVEVRYVSGQTGFALGSSLLTVGGSYTPSAAGMTSGIHIPSSVAGSLPLITGLYPFYLGSLGTSGVVFNVTRYYSNGL